METTNIYNEDLVQEIPSLLNWSAGEENSYMIFREDYVEANYGLLGLNDNNKLGLFIINKKHYKDRMEDICNTINYFFTFFDKDLELFHSMLHVKFIIDQKPNLSKKAFRNFVLDEIITDSFIQKIKNMMHYLYQINIDTDAEGKYKNTPKITNDQAKIIVAVSFTIRCILPICIHFSDTNTNFENKKSYIACFDKLIMKIIHKFEKNEVEVFNSLCNFIKYRVDRLWSSDIGICKKKQQLYGITKDLYLEEIIHEVVLVKSLYKLEYYRSVVSFIDGVIFRYHYNFKIENFKSKPIEIDAQENAADDSERISHMEAIEMMVYMVDESNALINEVNAEQVVNHIRKQFNITLSEEEKEFYNDKVKISPVTKFFIETFYNRFFHEPNAILNMERELIIELLIYMKHYLQYKGMILIPQLCTARMKGKYKENSIKNSKFIEHATTSDAWTSVIQERFTYINEVNKKEDYLLKKLSSFINSQFEFVDFNGPDDGLVYEDVDQDLIIKEFSQFLTII